MPSPKLNNVRLMHSFMPQNRLLVSAFLLLHANTVEQQATSFFTFTSFVGSRSPIKLTSCFKNAHFFVMGQNSLFGIQLRPFLLHATRFSRSISLTRFASGLPHADYLKFCAPDSSMGGTSQSRCVICYSKGHVNGCCYFAHYNIDYGEFELQKRHCDHDDDSMVTTILPRNSNRTPRSETLQRLNHAIV